jgi:glycosyltransferase involved in cell wall biosynthesis
MIPSIRGRMVAIYPGVEVERFLPRPRREALLAAAARLVADGSAARGRPPGLQLEVREAVARRDAGVIDEIAGWYDQTAPDQEAADRLRALAEPAASPLVGYLGKLIPQKGVDILLGALRLMRTPAEALVIGFGLHREWLTALADALETGDLDAARWLQETSGMAVELVPAMAPASAGARAAVTFTGRLDHRYAPEALAALDVLVVPSVLDEAFGMVAAEGAAAGALPLVSRHSGLAEVGAALEAAVGRPGLFTFEPGPGSTARLAQGLERLLELPPTERLELRDAISGFVRREWTWRHTAEALLAAASGSVA